jgi:hypothetical protein
LIDTSVPIHLTITAHSHRVDLLRPHDYAPESGNPADLAPSLHSGETAQRHVLDIAPPHLVKCLVLRNRDDCRNFPVHAKGKDLEPSISGRKLPNKHGAAHGCVACHQLGVGCGDSDPSAARHLETQRIERTQGRIVPTICSRALVSYYWCTM